jgi:succinate dehydrogenase subunit C
MTRPPATMPAPEVQAATGRAARAQSLAWALQRATAIALVPLVAVHIAVMVYAVRGGLSAAEILGRLRGSTGWLLLYGLLVTAAAIHAALGLRTVGIEWLRLGARTATLAAWAIGVGLFGLGWRAVLGLVLGAAP